MGVSPYASVNELWLRKAGRIPDPEPSEEMAKRLEIGHIGEGFIAELFALDTGFYVYDDTRMYQHDTYDWALANVDRLYTDDKGRVGILEIKTVSAQMKKEWDDGAVPPYYETQVRFYMGVLGIDRAAIIGCWGFGANDYSIVYIDRDLRIEKQLFDTCAAFIQSLVDGVEPPVQGNGEKEKSAILASMGKLRNETLTLPPSKAAEGALDIQKRIKQKKDEIKDLENQMALYQAEIIRLLGGASSGFFSRSDAENRIFFEAKNILTKRLDTTQLKKTNPEIYEANCKESTSTRITVKEMR